MLYNNNIHKCWDEHIKQYMTSSTWGLII
jgi:hypothetical protein